MAEALLLRSGVLSDDECPNFRISYEGRGKGSGGLILFVQTWAGENFCIELDPCATIADLKRQIEEVEGTPAGMQRLNYLGQPLANNQEMLADSGVCPESVVHMEAGADDAVVELRVVPGTNGTCSTAGCGACGLLTQNCGIFRRVPASKTTREIDKFVRVARDSDPRPCSEMLKHVRVHTYKCELGDKCWYYMHLNSAVRYPFIRRQVRKGITLKGGLSEPDAWEFGFDRPRGPAGDVRNRLWQDVLLAQWAKDGAGAKSSMDAKHFKSRGGAYPAVDCGYCDLPLAAALKSGLKWKIPEDGRGMA